jgi:hypothetical protein
MCTSGIEENWQYFRRKERNRRKRKKERKNKGKKYRERDMKQESI